MWRIFQFQWSSSVNVRRGFGKANEGGTINLAGKKKKKNS
jgi:hypothetical protein